MSHHFDTPSGREDPRLNLCDLYLFDAGAGRTAMALTVNPEADPAAAPLFRSEAVHAFRFDTDGDGREDVTFTAAFGEAHSTGSGRYEQPYEVRRATGAAAIPGGHGQLIAVGSTSDAVQQSDGVSVFASQVHDAFAGNAQGLQDFGAALTAGSFVPESFSDAESSFAGRQVAAVVLEVPTDLIGDGAIEAWATVSLRGHAPEQQVARFGLPLITHLFLGDDDSRERFNQTPPSGDNSEFLARIAAVVRGVTTLAGTSARPDVYAQRVLDRFGTLNLPYVLGTPASMDFAGTNGRTLDNDVMDVMLSVMTNSALADGARTDSRRISDTFPYLVAALATGTDL
jgi:hypothetical protein